MKKTVLFLVLLAAVFPVFSSSLEELVGKERAGDLRGGETLTRILFKTPQLVLLPEHPGARQLVEKAFTEIQPDLFAESLFLYKKPGAEVWTEAERTALYNGALKLSSLAGIQYYSASRKKMRTFYEYSRIIDDPSTKKELPDPVYGNPPASLVLYARQKDLTFGDNIYEYRFFTDRDYLIFTQENVTSMWYGIIPVLGKNQLRSVVAVIDTGDALLIYAVSMAKAPALPGMGEKVGNSFSNRTAAILKWFSAEADKVFRK